MMRKRAGQRLQARSEKVEHPVSLTEQIIQADQERMQQAWWVAICAVPHPGEDASIADLDRWSDAVNKHYMQAFARVN